MNLYLVKTTLHIQYNCAEGFVVAAPNEKVAKVLTMEMGWGGHQTDNPTLLGTLYCEKLGVSSEHRTRVILRSFNAG